MKQAVQLQFAICVRNDAADDLEIRKVYQVLPDSAAAKADLVRVIDESGEDYLYSTSYFVLIELSPEAEDALSSAVR